MCINAYHLMKNEAVESVEVNLPFGEYANPSFESQVETVGKAKQSGIMSIERCVEELYGDSLDDDCKREEIARLKAEQGIQSIPEPEIRTDAGEFRINGFTGGSDGSKSSEKTYRMNREEYQGLLKVASEQVPKGIYAVEKGNYAELRCDHCTSVTQIKTLTRQFKSQGFKVYANGR